LLATGFKVPKRNFLFSCGNMGARLEFLGSAQAMAKLGFVLFATKGTAAFLEQNGVKAVVVHKVSSGQHPNVVDMIKSGEIDLVVNIPDSANRQEVGVQLHYFSDLIFYR
jgi:carbamoyl-phosphate synthase large subunit